METTTTETASTTVIHIAPSKCPRCDKPVYWVVSDGVVSRIDPNSFAPHVGCKPYGHYRIPIEGFMCNECGDHWEREQLDRAPVGWRVIRCNFCGHHCWFKPDDPYDLAELSS